MSRLFLTYLALGSLVMKQYTLQINKVVAAKLPLSIQMEEPLRFYVSKVSRVYR